MFTVVNADTGELIKVFDVKETPDGILLLIVVNGSIYPRRIIFLFTNLQKQKKNMPN